MLHRVGSVFVVQSLFTDFELLFLERGLPPSGADLALAVRDGIRGCYSLLQRLSSQKAIGFNKAGPLLKHGA